MSIALSINFPLCKLSLLKCKVIILCKRLRLFSGNSKNKTVRTYCHKIRSFHKTSPAVNMLLLSGVSEAISSRPDCHEYNQDYFSMLCNNTCITVRILKFEIWFDGICKLFFAPYSYFTIEIQFLYVNVIVFINMTKVNQNFLK